MENHNIQSSLNASRLGGSALDAFLNVLSLFTLGWTSIAFGGVVFQIINKYAGSPRVYYEGFHSGSALKFHIASLLIITPIFLVVTGILHRFYKEQKLSPASGVHRWLTYFMLFIAFANIVGGLIALVTKFLDGVYFSTFIWKALTILVIALGIFGYYAYDLRRRGYENRSQVSLISALVVVIFALAAIINGFFISGSPQNARILRFDEERVQNLSSLRWAIDDYYRSHKKLPDNLSAEQFEDFKDPETRGAYGYKKVKADAYQLCAAFALSSKEGKKADSWDRYYQGSDDWYYHKRGEECYEVIAPSITSENEKFITVPAKRVE